MEDSMRFSPGFTIAITAVSAFAATPVLAAGMTPGAIFKNANIPVKLMMIALVIAMIAAVVVTVRKVASGHISGGSTYLASLRLGGPLIGLLGASLNGLWTLIGIASVGPSVPLEAFAPGLAEAMLALSLGLLSGVVAVICHWAVESRVDRMVLKA
jgi:biopolymer transport protein ExbB/TolQ